MGFVDVPTLECQACLRPASEGAFISASGNSPHPKVCYDGSCSLRVTAHLGSFDILLSLDSENLSCRSSPARFGLGANGHRTSLKTGTRYKVYMLRRRRGQSPQEKLPWLRRRELFLAMFSSCLHYALCRCAATAGCAFSDSNDAERQCFACRQMENFRDDAGTASGKALSVMTLCLEFRRAKV